ncbi:MAG: hypothetical protein ACRESZ_20175 [Methylococcales bacterium]
MSKWYKINLLPLGPYFFGQEITAELGNRQSYFQRSAVFPQQSTLLGLLRYQILVQHGLAKPSVEGAIGNPQDLVADQGFKPKPENCATSYGAILNLSPVFLQRNGTGHYFLCDHEFVKEKEKTYELIPGKKINYHSLPGEKSTSLHLTCKCIAEGTVKDYVNKYPFCETIVDLTGKEKFELSSVIRETKQVGVYKHHSRDGEDASSDRAYFKSVYQQMVTLEEIARNNTIYKETFHKKPLDASLQLSPEWTFAFYAELENDQTLAVSEHRIAFMGKEKSAFLIQITDQDIDPSWMSCSAASGLEKVILLSDAYVPESELLKHSLLINGKTVRFRSFSRNISSHKFEYANLKRDGKGEKGDKSESHHLLKRGSVIYTENSSAIAGILKTQKHWRTIGYNYFTVKQAK